jgi:glycosyltransferase involved in cell wall biosynthesis
MRLTELVTPLKPLEAMALGRLVLASDVGGHRELMRDGVTGVLFRPGTPDLADKRWVCSANRPAGPRSNTPQGIRGLGELEKVRRNYIPANERLVERARAE